MLSIGHDLSLPRLGAGRASGAAIASFLAGTTNILFDFAAPATLWQTDDTSAPVTAAGQSIGRAAGGVFTQASAAARPTWQTTFLAAAVDDHLTGSGTALSLTNGASAVTFGCSFMVNSLVTQSSLIAFSTTSSAVRFLAYVITAGEIGMELRRLAADSLPTRITTGAGITTGVRYTLIVTADYANNATYFWVNGVLITTLTATGVAGTVEAYDSLRARFCANVQITAGEFMNGNMYRQAFVVRNKVPTIAEVAAMHMDLMR